MQTMEDVKKHCGEVGEGIAAAVAGVVALVAFSGDGRRDVRSADV